jgi:hypothetical protein
MSIFDMFRPTQQVVAAPTPTPIKPADPLAQNNPAAIPGSTESTNAPTNPLDAFKDVWKPADVQAQSADPFSAPYLNLDESKLQQGLKQVDFTRGMNPELIQKAMSGDAQAFMDVLNHTSRESFAQATRLQAATTESALRKQSDRVKEYLPNAVKAQNLSSQPINNPALDHPAVQPLLQVLRGQLAQQNPNMSPSEIAARAENFFLSSAQAVNAHNPEAKAQTAAQARENAKFDFSDYVG